MAKKLDLEIRLRELTSQASQISDESKRKDVQRQIDELRNSTVNQELEERLAEYSLQVSKLQEKLASLKEDKSFLRDSFFSTLLHLYDGISEFVKHAQRPLQYLGITAALVAGVFLIREGCVRQSVEDVVKGKERTVISRNYLGPVGGLIRGGIYVETNQGEKKIYSSVFPEHISSIALSPDEKRVAFLFSNNHTKDEVIYVVNSDGTNLQQLVEINESDITFRTYKKASIQGPTKQFVAWEDSDTIRFGGVKLETNNSSEIKYYVLRIDKDNLRCKMVEYNPAGPTGDKPIP